MRPPPAVAPAASPVSWDTVPPCTPRPSLNPNPPQAAPGPPKSSFPPHLLLTPPAAPPPPKSHFQGG